MTFGDVIAGVEQFKLPLLYMKVCSYIFTYFKIHKQLIDNG